MAQTLPPTTTQTISPIVFGILSTLLSVYAAWQAHRLYNSWHERRSRRHAEEALESHEFTSLISHTYLPIYNLL